MSICVATTFVGYNFTISNALETNFVDENGNKIANAQVVKYNEKATKPEGLEKEGYDLSWELNDKVYDFNESVTDNITLKAKYTPKKYEVKFQDNFGNTIADTVEVTHNETVTEPEAEKKEYYSFKEWQLDGKKYDFSNKIVKPLTLVGEYDKPIGYYVCFIKNEQLHDSRNFIDITKDINAKSKVDKSVLDALYGFDTKNVKGRTKDISEVKNLSQIKKLYENYFISELGRRTDYYSTLYEILGMYSGKDSNGQAILRIYSKIKSRNMYYDGKAVEYDYLELSNLMQNSNNEIISATRATITSDSNLNGEMNSQEMDSRLRLEGFSKIN